MPVPDNIESVPMFFILGRTRSGTTMLRSMFDAHPNVAIPPEFPVLASLVKFRRENWTLRTIDEFAGIVAISRKFPNMRIDADKIKQTLIPEFEKRGGMNLNLAYRILQSLFVSSFEKNEILAIGDKNPLYAMYADLLRRNFPDAKFIFLRRHLLSVVDSVYKTNFELHWPSVIGHKWKRAWNLSVKDSHLNFSSNFQIRYEDIVSDPETELKKLCSFIGIPYHERMMLFNQPEKLSAVYGDALESAHKSLLSDVSRTVVPEWTEAHALRHRIALAWAGKSLSEAGYNSVVYPCRWWYYLIGIPEFLIFRLIRLTDLFFRFIKGHRYQGNMKLKIALRLYGAGENGN